MILDPKAGMPMDGRSQRLSMYAKLHRFTSADRARFIQAISYRGIKGSIVDTRTGTKPIEPCLDAIWVFQGVVPNDFHRDKLKL